MSYYDLSSLSNEELIAQYFIERRNSGAFLSYHEYKIIDAWLAAAENDTKLVLYLLHKEFEIQDEGSDTRARTLKSLHRKILNKIIKAKVKL